MIHCLAHVCFTVSNLDASLKFYRDALGFEEAFPFINDAGERFGQYLHIGGNTFLELFIGDPAARDDSQSYLHFCLQVDDIAAETARLRTAGVEVSEPKTGSDKSMQAWLTDPDGNRIELHQYTADSKQAPWVE